MARSNEVSVDVAAGRAADAETLVFINYRSSDAASAAAFLHAELSDRFGREAVFLDYESIPLGRDFEPELLTRVRSCAVLLVVVSDRWLDGEIGQRPIDSPDHWVRREIMEALEHGVPVVPVLIGGGKIVKDRLPAELELLTNLQYFEIHRLQRTDIRALGDYLVRQIPRLEELLSRYSDDVRALREATEANLRALAWHAELPAPSGQIKIPRADLTALVDVDGDFVVSGEPGCGKSGLLFEFTQHLLEHGEDVVLLTVDTLGGGPGAVRDDIVLSEPLVKVLAHWSGERRATLLIDGLDAARGESLRWLANLVTELGSTRWRTVATMRRFDLRYSRLWKSTFVGSPVSDDPGRRHRDLLKVRHYWLENLSAEELADLADRESSIAQLVSKADDRFLTLLCNPFNLRLACDLLLSGTASMSLAGTRDQLELLQLYWQARVTEPPNREARERVLSKLSHAMLERRILRASGNVVPDALLDVRKQLVSDGVLNEVPGPLRASGQAPLAFSHHILFDYAIAALVLAPDGESRLASALDDDANLVLVVCPSIDLHLADLWHAVSSRSLFAEVVVTLARRCCSIAGVAAARVVVTEVADANDLAWLITMSTQAPDVDVPVLGWLTSVMEAADEPVRKRVRSAIEAWLDLVTASISRLSQDFQQPRAQQAARMLWQLDRLDPMRPDTAGAPKWAECVTALMHIALTEPESRAWLGHRLTRLLPQTVAINPAHATLLQRTLTSEITNLWPPDYMLHYVNKIETIAAGAPDAARDVLVAVLSINDDRDDVTYLTEGVLTMTSTRRQDLDGVKSAVSRHMSGFIARAGLNYAMPVLAKALEIRESGLPAQVPSYPIHTTSVDGHVNMYAPTLEYGPGHGAAERIAKAFANGLTDVDPNSLDLQALVDDLVASVHHPEAWSHLLNTAAQRPADIGLAFLPTLSAGGLLVHPDTRAAAARFTESLSPTASNTEHEALEQAILNAPGLLDDPTGERTNRFLDQFASRLQLGRIQNPDLAARAATLAAQGVLPEIPEPSRPEAFFVPDTLRDHLGEEEHDRLSPEQREILDALRLAVDATANNSTPEQLPALEQALRHVLNTNVIDEDSSQPTRLLILRAINILVRGSQPDPDSDLANLIMPILLQVAQQTDEPGEEDLP